MAGKFAPVLDEPAKWNASSVGATNAGPAQYTEGNPWVGVAQAAATGVDLFLKYKDKQELRDIAKDLDAVDQGSVDEVLSRGDEAKTNREADDVAFEDVPVAAAKEISKLDKLKIAQAQGRISEDEMNLRRMAGARKIKAQYPDRIPEINAMMQSMWGYRPSNALIDSALKDERLAEAEQDKFKQAAWAAASFYLDPVTGEVGPPKRPDGSIDREAAYKIGSEILRNSNKADLLKKNYEVDRARLLLAQAKAESEASARKALQELDAKVASDARKLIDEHMSTDLLTKLSAFNLASANSDPASASPQDKIQAVQALVKSMDEGLKTVQGSFDWASLNQKTREDILNYAAERRKQILEPWLNKDFGEISLQARLLEATKTESELTVWKNPKMAKFLALGEFGGEWLEMLSRIDQPGLRKFFEDTVQEFMADEDVPAPAVVAENVTNIVTNPEAVATMKPRDAAAYLRMAATVNEGFAKGDAPLTPKQVESYYNTNTNLHKAAANLANPEDKRQAMVYVSNEAFYQRMAELEKIDPQKAEDLARSSLAVVGEGIKSIGGMVKNLPGFSTNWDMRFDPEEGAFVVHPLKLSPDRGLMPGQPGADMFPARSPEGDAEAFLQRGQLDRANALAMDMNLALRTVSQYGDLSKYIKPMEEFQRREAMAGLAMLPNVEGKTSTLSTFRSGHKAEVEKLSNHIKSVSEMLTHLTRSVQRGTAAAIANREGAKAGSGEAPAVIRRIYDPVSRTFKEPK